MLKTRRNSLNKQHGPICPLLIQTLGKQPRNLSSASMSNRNLDEKKLELRMFVAPPPPPHGFQADLGSVEGIGSCLARSASQKPDPQVQKVTAKVRCSKDPQETSVVQLTMGNVVLIVVPVKPGRTVHIYIQIYNNNYLYSALLGRWAPNCPFEVRSMSSVSEKAPAVTRSTPSKCLSIAGSTRRGAISPPVL